MTGHHEDHTGEPQAEPARTLDTLEEKTLGATQDQVRDEPEEQPTGQDIDPEDVTADHGGHTGGESSG